MHDIVLVGLNHKTSPVELRECLALNDEEIVESLAALQKTQTVGEVIVLSTCNRVEVLMTADDCHQAAALVKTYLAGYKKVPVAQFENLLYVKAGEEAVRHVFRVASSLDSMIVGEPQILGQIKEAYRTSTVNKTSGVILNRLLHRTFFVAKRIRTETGIGGSAVSISYAAVELAKKIFGALTKKRVLLLGAGEMAELAVEHLIRNQVGDIFVANRTFARGVELAQKFNGRPVRLEEVDDHLTTADIIISSTGSPDFVIRPQQVKNCMRSRKNRPLFFIDIAVPRDIDPRINRLANTYVYDIDDLKGVIDENIRDRNKEAVKAERIVDEAVVHFRKWYDSLAVVPTIVGLRQKLTAIAQAELKKTMQNLKHLSEADGRAITQMTDALINKILHDPTLYLKRNGCLQDKSVHLDVIRKLFNLDQ
jgi:glutamyl-tRNA reductase